MSERYTITVPDGLAALVDGLARQSGTTGEVPTMSKARICRLLLADAAARMVEGDFDLHGQDLPEDLTVEDLLGVIKEHHRARFLYEETKNEAWVDDMRGGFEGRVRDRLAERFKNGYDPDAAAALAEHYINEARIFWLVIDDDRETFEEMEQYVYDRISDYRERYEETTWDHEEDWLGSFEGVEAGRDQEVVAESAVEIAEDVARRIGPQKDPELVVMAVAKKYGVSENHVWDLVRAVRGSDGPLSSALPTGALEGVADD